MFKQETQRIINICRSYWNPDKPYGPPVSKMPETIEAELRDFVNTIAAPSPVAAEDSYNAGLEAAAQLEFVKVVPVPPKSTWDVSIGPYGICNDIKSEQHAKEIATPLNHAIATAIRALSVK